MLHCRSYATSLLRIQSTLCNRYPLSPRYRTGPRMAMFRWEGHMISVCSVDGIVSKQFGAAAKATEEPPSLTGQFLGHPANARGASHPSCLRLKHFSLADCCDCCGAAEVQMKILSLFQTLAPRPIYSRSILIYIPTWILTFIGRC